MNEAAEAYENVLKYAPISEPYFGYVQKRVEELKGRDGK